MDSDFRVKLVRVEVDHAARKKGTESSLPLNDRRVATACRLEGGSNGWPAQGTTLVPKNILGEEGPWGGERGALRAQPRHCVDRRRSSVFWVVARCVKGSSQEGQGQESPRLLGKALDAEQELGLWPVDCREPQKGLKLGGCGQPRLGELCTSDLPHGGSSLILSSPAEKVRNWVGLAWLW